MASSAPMNRLDRLPMGRRALKHKPFLVPYSGVGWDEDLTFNTQASSQWDSLCHWQHQPSNRAYNGFSPTMEGLSGTSTAENSLPTLDHWHTRGGLVARGVLIDFASWAEETGVDFSPLNGYAITIEEIEAVAAHQGVTFRPGDVFVLRTGMQKVLVQPFEELMSKMGAATISGVESSVKSAKWFWNQRFAAVATDTNAFERVSTAGGKLNLGKICRFMVLGHPADMMQFSMSTSLAFLVCPLVSFGTLRRRPSTPRRTSGTPSC
jgi:putative cyclase